MNFIIETERLLLREFDITDAQEMYLMNADPNVLLFTGDEPFKSITEVWQFILQYDQYKKHKMGRYTVLLKETNEYIGWCGLKYQEETGEVDLGYRFKKEKWGRGYATEAALACINYGFDKLKLKRIIGRALKENTTSIKILEKIGMHFEMEVVLHDAPAVVYAIENNQPNS